MIISDEIVGEPTTFLRWRGSDVLTGYGNHQSLLERQVLPVIELIVYSISLLMYPLTSNVCRMLLSHIDWIRLLKHSLVPDGAGLSEESHRSLPVLIFNTPFVVRAGFEPATKRQAVSPFQG